MVGNLSQNQREFFHLNSVPRQKHFIVGDLQEVSMEDYTSHNTRRISVKEVEELLLTLPEIRAEIKN